MDKGEQISFFKSKEFKNKLKLTLSGISGAFMLPIATLAITSLFLVFGGFLESVSETKAVLKVTGKAIKSIAFPILQAIPLLFCVAFTISFCNNDPLYIWACILSYIVFLSVQNVFIQSSGGDGGFTVLFPGLGRDPKIMKGLVDKQFGVRSLNTSIFGSFVIGAALMPYIRRKWSNVNLPTYFSFFSGKRFVPLVAVLGGAWISLLFLIFWPWIGYFFNLLGKGISKTPFGIDSFIFGLLEKSLIPFGLHHMFYSPLWYSSVGGNASLALTDTLQSATSSSALVLGNNGSTTGNGTSTAIQTATQVLSEVYKGESLSNAMWQGDSFMGVSILSLPSNHVIFKNGSSGSSNSSLPVMDFFKKKLNIHVGRFTSGKYPVMQFGLPCAGIAMIHAAENRKEATATLIPAMLNSFLMGITEPMEFTFLFLAPKLFYGFHAVACGFSFMLMNLLGAHIPSIFSGGFIEFILLGVVPMAKGTNPLAMLVVGCLMAPLYYWVFSFFIKYLDLKTPGRAGVVAETTQAEVSSSKVPEKTRKLAIAFGGWDNLGKISNCASRLRYDIVDKSKVDEAALKAAGVIAVKWIGDNHVQAIVGPQAESINNEMLKWRGEDLGVGDKNNG